MKYRNSEGYADPTAGAAIAHIAYEERRQRRLEQKKQCGNSRSKKKSGAPNPHAAWVQVWPPINGKTNRRFGGK